MLRVLIDGGLERRARLAYFFFLPLLLGEKEIGGPAGGRSWIPPDDFLKIGGGLCGRERVRRGGLTAIGVDPIPPPGGDREKREKESRKHFFLVPVPEHLGLEHWI